MSSRFRGLKGRLPIILRSMFAREKSCIFEKKLDGPPFKIEAKVKVDVKLVQSDDISKLPKRSENFDSEVKKRFEMGHICFGAHLHGKIVHYKWVAFSKSIPPYSDLERRMRISSDSAYIYDGYTVPEYRGLGISAKVMEKTLQYLQEIGIKKVYSYVRYDNFPMLRVKQKEKFRKIGTITYTQIFRLRLHRCEGETEEDYKKLREMFAL